MKEIALEWLKEFLRVICLAIIPVLILGLENGVMDWRLVITTGLIAALRAIEKSLHDTGSKVQLPF